MLVEPLQLPGFNRLLDQNCSTFPLAMPKAHVQWLPGVSYRPGKAERVEGWVVHVPGLCQPRFFRRKERADAYHAYLTRLTSATRYFAVNDGHLFDYRSGSPVKLRHEYRALFPLIRNGRELIATLRAIPLSLNKASHYFKTATESCLCPACVVEELKLVINAIRGDIDYEWQVVAWDLHWEEVNGTPLTCDNCCRVISPVFEEGTM